MENRLTKVIVKYSGSFIGQWIEGRKARSLLDAANAVIPTRNSPIDSIGSKWMHFYWNSKIVPNNHAEKQKLIILGFHNYLKILDIQIRIWYIDDWSTN